MAAHGSRGWECRGAAAHDGGQLLCDLGFTQEQQPEGGEVWDSVCNGAHAVVNSYSCLQYTLRGRCSQLVSTPLAGAECPGVPAVGNKVSAILDHV